MRGRHPVIVIFNEYNKCYILVDLAVENKDNFWESAKRQEKG